MSFANLPDTLYKMFNELKDRLDKLERSGRFTAPNVSSDPSAPRKGDIVLNTTSNSLKYVDNSGSFIPLGASTAVSAVTATAPITSSGGLTPNIALTNVGTAGTYTKVTTDASGRVSSGTTLAAGDIPGTLNATNINDQLQIFNAGSGASKIEIGNGATGNQYAYIDFVGDTTYTDYGMRIIRSNGGANTDSSIENRGSGGLHLSAPEGVIRAYTAATARMIIDNSGRITTPTQPAFIASNPSTGNTTYAAGAVVAFSTVVQNVGSYYNSSTSRFTAPVAGFYMLYFIAYNNSPTSGLRVNICINGGSYAGQGSVGVASNQDFQQTIIMYMNANDYADVRVNYANTVIYNAPGHTTFGGRLLG
jgi:hypothetical protein